jgi:hypothetical protein
MDVSIPAHQVNGNGIGEIRWHPDTGLMIHIEAAADETFAVPGRLTPPSESAAGAGAVREPSRAPQLVGHILGTGDSIRVFELAVDVKRVSQLSTAGSSMKTVISETAMAATVRIERDSDLSFSHETTGECRLLIPDLWIHQWPKRDNAEWKTCDTYHSSELSVELVMETSKQDADVAAEAYSGLLRLRELHCEMDEAVLVAYGWHEPTDVGPPLDLRHDFYEVDYLPENDRVRFTIHPDTRRELLKRLLLLNHKRHAEEQEAARTNQSAAKSSACKKAAKKKSAGPTLFDKEA